MVGVPTGLHDADARHPDIGDQPARGRPHQVLDEHAVVEERHEGRVVEGDGHHVGLGPGCQDPEVGPTEGPSGPPGGEVECRGGRQRPGVLLTQTGQHGGQAHLLPQVEVVVGGRPVGAQPDPQAPVEQVHQRGDARSQLGVRLRAVGDGHVVGDQDVDVGRRQPDAVGGQHPTVEHPGRGQHLGDGAAVLGGECRRLRRAVSARWIWNSAPCARAAAAVATRPGNGTV